MFAKENLYIAPWSCVWNVNPTFATGRWLPNREEDWHYCRRIDVKLESTPIRHLVYDFTWHMSKSLVKNLCLFFLDASKHKKEDGQVQSSEVSFVHFQLDNLVTGFELMKCSKVNTSHTASWECHSCCGWYLVLTCSVSAHVAHFYCASIYVRVL